MLQKERKWNNADTSLLIFLLITIIQDLMTCFDIITRAPILVDQSSSAQFSRLTFVNNIFYSRLTLVDNIVISDSFSALVYNRKEMGSDSSSFLVSSVRQLWALEVFRLFFRLIQMLIQRFLPSRHESNNASECRGQEMIMMMMMMMMNLYFGASALLFDRHLSVRTAFCRPTHILECLSE